MISERVDAAVTRWSKIGGLILLGWMGGSSYHSTATLTQKAVRLETVQRVDIPKLKAAVKCEDRRADKSAAVAGQAILGATIDSAPVPKFKDIPNDNCQHPKL